MGRTILKCLLRFNVSKSVLTEIIKEHNKTIKTSEVLLRQEHRTAPQCPMVPSIDKLLEIAAEGTPSPISITVPLPKGLAGGQCKVPSMPLWDVLIRSAAEVPLEDFAPHRGGGVASPEWFPSTLKLPAHNSAAMKVKEKFHFADGLATAHWRRMKDALQLPGGGEISLPAPLEVGHCSLRDPVSVEKQFRPSEAGAAGQTWSHPSNGVFLRNAAERAKARGALSMPLVVFMDEVHPDGAGKHALYPMMLWPLAGDAASMRKAHRATLLAMPPSPKRLPKDDKVLREAGLTSAAATAQAAQSMVLSLVLQPLLAIQKMGGIPKEVTPEQSLALKSAGYRVSQVTAHSRPRQLVEYVQMMPCIIQLSADMVEAWDQFDLLHRRCVQCRCVPGPQLSSLASLKHCQLRVGGEGAGSDEAAAATGHRRGALSAWEAAEKVLGTRLCFLRPPDPIHAADTGAVAARCERFVLAAMTVGPGLAAREALLKSRWEAVKGVTINGTRLDGGRALPWRQNAGGMMRSAERVSRAQWLPLIVGHNQDIIADPQLHTMVQVLCHCTLVVQAYMYVRDTLDEAALLGMQVWLARMVGTQELIAELVQEAASKSGGSGFSCDTSTHYPKAHEIQHLPAAVAGFGVVAALDTDNGEGRHPALIRLWKLCNSAFGAANMPKLLTYASIRRDMLVSEAWVTSASSQVAGEELACLLQGSPLPEMPYLSPVTKAREVLRSPITVWQLLDREDSGLARTIRAALEPCVAGMSLDGVLPLGDVNTMLQSVSSTVGTGDRMVGQVRLCSTVLMCFPGGNTSTLCFPAFVVVREEQQQGAAAPAIGSGLFRAVAALVGDAPQDHEKDASIEEVVLLGTFLHPDEAHACIAGWKYVNPLDVAPPANAVGGSVLIAPAVVHPTVVEGHTYTEEPDGDPVLFWLPTITARQH